MMDTTAIHFVVAHIPLLMIPAPILQSDHLVTTTNIKLGWMVDMEQKEAMGVMEQTEFLEQTLILQTQGVQETQGTTRLDAASVTSPKINSWSSVIERKEINCLSHSYHSEIMVKTYFQRS